MGIIYGVGDANSTDEAVVEHPPLRETIAADPAYSPATALSLMMFVMIYLSCIATLAVVRKELGSWKWSAFLAVYTLLLGYGLAVLVYQVSILIGLAA